MRVLSYRVYVGTLQGRESHYDAQSIFELHVRGPFPKLAIARQDRPRLRSCAMCWHD